ncbi:MAG: imidazoleglycerol-phosphate dehydratase HisB [Oscillospiraceae bacterium]|nr:imidazoleglycerol-phosphate dehydratase HisB [Oscillospiraceae bacterium]
MREAKIVRKTNETDISLYLNLDGKGESMIDTGCGFLDHMLTLFSRHARFDLSVKCVGDSHVDWHHTVEDVGICLGQALKQALGDMKGITRYGFMILPMDETLILSSVDISGRAQLCYGLNIPTQKVGEFDTELTEEFMLAFVRNANLTLHLKQLDGKNSHHIIEGTFKSLARSLKQAVKIDKEAENEIPSTKGVL